MEKPSIDKLFVDEEINDLCRTLTPEELSDLRANIEANGFLDTIKVWWDSKGDVILDGHNRYDIWVNLPEGFEIEPPVIERILLGRSREDAKIWVLRNQLARRNNTPAEVKYLRGKLYELTKKGHGDPARFRGKSAKTPSAAAKGQNGLLGAETTAGQIGDQDKVGQRTVKRDAEYANALDIIGQNVSRAAVDEILSGAVSIPHKALLEIAELPKGEQRAGYRRARSGQPVKETEPKDREGNAIPKRHRETFETAGLIRGLVNQAGAIMNKAEELAKKKGGEYLPISQVKIEGKNLQAALKDGAPHAMCPSCKWAGCLNCEHHGWMHAQRYEGIPKERRA